MKTYRAIHLSYRHDVGQRWPARLALSVLTLATLLLALGALAAPGRARAAGPGGQIIFVAPIYAGQNNGDPEGPVTTGVSIAGSGWTGASGVTVTLADRQSDTSGDT